MRRSLATTTTKNRRRENGKHQRIERNEWKLEDDDNDDDIQRTRVHITQITDNSLSLPFRHFDSL